ncbi:MAG: alkaline phosphatase D family protein [Acidobacteriota bacterium]
MARRLARRDFVRKLGSGVCSAAAVGAAGTYARSLFPGIVRAQGTLPQMPQGVAAGIVGVGQGIVWSRADRPGRLFVEYATTERFENVTRVRGPAATASTDLTARVLLPDLPPGQRIFYRVRFQDLSDLRAWSDPLVGSFTSPSAVGDRDLTIAFSADTVGQGWGLNPDFGGLRLYEPMRAAAPDVFVHCGDTIYADQPLQAEVALDDGTIWRNVVTEAKAKVAESVDEFRGNYRYNLQDAHMRAFNADVAQVVLWDDHEVRDNWYETRDLSRDARYTEKRMALLAARARQAFLEYHPLPIVEGDAERIHRRVPCGPLAEIFALDLRSFRGPNSPNRQAVPGDESALAGAGQIVWLKSALETSRAAWKVIASDLPIGLVVRDGPEHFEAIANADDGPPLGREHEIADLLRFIRDRRIRNVVWITGDVHYCAAHHYDPARARFTEFDPFWEFVAGPLHAGTFGPNPLDATFGPEVRFSGVPPGMKPNRPPSAGLQFYGLLTIDARTRALTATLHDLTGRALFSQTLEPAR